MQKVNDLSHFSRLVQSRKRWMYTNCYLLPDSIIGYTDKCRMLYSLLENGILFLCQENDFDYLYFYLDGLQPEDGNIHKVLPKKPIVIDLIFRGGEVPGRIQDVIRFWENYGFDIHDEYRHMVYERAISKSGENESIQLPEEFALVTPNEDQFDDIDKLLRSNLDVFSSPLPDINELASMSNEGSLQILIEKGSNVAGVLCSKITGKVNTIQKVVVAPEYRNRGFADLLVKANIIRSSTASFFDLWVKDGNSPAIRLYEKNGYHADGKRIIQLLKH